MFVQDGFLYLIVTRHKLTVHRVLTPPSPPCRRGGEKSAPSDLDTGQGEIIHRKKKVCDFPVRESLVSDIPSGGRKIVNLFLQCINTSY
jgi:hypothetical protein